MSLIARLVAPVVIGFFVVAAAAQNLTVQVGAPPLPPTPLVEHTNIWRWHKGTNAPTVGWQTISDASLDATWGSGPGGFGYSTDTPNETNQCRTVLFDMSGASATNYSTFYIRQTFSIDGSVDTNRHIRLTMDWDDGFIAWFDGIFITNRSTTATEPLYTATASPNHESSRGTSGGPIETYDLGAVATRTGTHVLAIIGLNGSKSGSSDFVLIPDLSLAAPTNGGVVPNNGLYALASENTVTLTGTNTVPGATRVTVNGDESTFNPGLGTWSNTVSLVPGFNRLFIAALDGNGNMLSNLTQDVVYEVSPVNVSGVLAGNTFWTNTSQVIHITSTATVPSGGTLTIGPGVVVIVSPGASLLAAAGGIAGGIIDVQGADTREVYFLPATSGVWTEIAADGANSFLTIRHADINRGAVKFRNGATGLLEDSYVHEYKNGTTPIAGCTSAAGVTVRRSHFSVYHETLWQDTLMTVEDCLFENADNASSDALDFDGAHVGSVIRRCTFRFGPQSNTDAIDIGPTGGGSGSTNTIIEGCLMHDFPNDKGVSIGEGSYGIVIRNCVIHHTESGVGVKNSPFSPTNKPPCTAIIYNTTITDCEFGLRCYHKQDPNSPTDGGQITNAFNNIVWGNLTNIGLYNAGIAIVDYSDIGGTNWPGTGNIDVNPLFVNPALRDYRVQPGSPTIGAGMGGTNMGPLTAVGGIPMWVSNLVVISSGTNAVTLSWRETADNEDGFHIERSTDKVAWVAVGSTAGNNTNFTDTTGLLGQKYYYRVRATNDLGVSPYSNLASGSRQAPVIFVGGTISVNTSWGPGVTVIVTSSVTVAASATLTINPCTQVLFNQGLSMTVNGLLIAEGTPDCRIVFTRNTGATSWNNINMLGTTGTNRLHYVDIDYSTGNLDANGTKLFLQNIWWTNTTAQLLTMVGTSVIFLDSYVPGGFGVEPIHFSNMPANGYALIKNNIFGAPQGYNDSVDFTGGNRPGPIVQFIDNIFLAAVDDCFDMDGTDAHIEGNIFMNVHQDAVRPSTSNPISTGADAGNQSELVIVRNIIFDCDHALLLKDLGSAIFENNTVVTIETNQFSASRAAYVQFGEPHRSVPGGRGILMNGNILWDLHSTTPFIVFTNGTMFMVANDNIIQGTNMTFGGNSTNDPMFVNWQTGITHLNIKSNLALLAGSPAIGTGPNGLDRGALVPGGASISGEPSGATTNTSATLTVAGPGIYAYRWKLNNGPWSAEVPLTNNFLITATMFSNAVPITLSGLPDGTYTVSVIGKNSAGFWQDTNSATISKTWTVGPSGDTDGDGMPDDWEDAHGLNKLVNDADGDLDGDGMKNLQEYLAGTDPQVFNSRLALFSLGSAGGNVSFSFVAVSNKTYTVQYRDSLSTGAWLQLQGVPAAAFDRLLNITNTPGTATRFYQVVTP